MKENKIRIENPDEKTLSWPLNIWHWTNLLVISGILITVLLVKTIFSGKENSPLVQKALEKKGILITFEQAKAVTKIYTHKLWDWHVYFGYVLAGLLIFRVAIEFSRPKHQKAFNIVRIYHNYKLKLSNNKQSAKQLLLVKCIYLLFYLDLILMVATGLFIKFSDDYPKLKSIRETVKDIHNFGMYIILTFIVLHLGGLLISEVDKKRAQ